MTPETRAQGRPATPPTSDERSALQQWRNGWGIALRMARREVRRHRGRSWLILLMVGLPTLLLSFAVTAGFTSQVTGAEQIPRLMGTGQAWVQPPQERGLEQGADINALNWSDTPATPIPGYASTQDAAANARAIGALTGGVAAPIGEDRVTTQLGERRINLTVLYADGRQPGVEGRVELRSGRWPAADGEVLLSQDAIRRGLPEHGSFEVMVHGTPRTLTVVGTMRAIGEWGQRSDLVSPVAWTPDTTLGWIITRPTPVTFADVQRLNTHGLAVASAQVLRHPPATSELPATVQESLSQQGERMGTLVTLGAVMLLLFTALLVGPAFAVSAARQRRTLALAASNGATTAQLRQTVLAQAVVLGVISAGTATVLGALAAYLMWWVVYRGGYPIGFDGPFDLPIGWLLFVGVISMLSAVLAAIAPALRLGRLDIIGVMRGQSVSPRPSRVLFLIGLVVAVGGGFGVIQAILLNAHEVPIVVAAVALVGGTLLMVPMILVVVGRLASRLPLSLRMAARDNARQRARSTPAVAAVLAGVALLALISVSSTSDTTQRRLEYSPRTFAGEGIINGMPGSLDGLAGALTAVDPGIRVIPTYRVTAPTSRMSKPPTEPYDEFFLNVVPPGCTPVRSAVDEQWSPPDQPPAPGEQPSMPPCQVAGTQTGIGNVYGVTSMPATEIVRRFELTGADADAIRAGGVVIVSDREVVKDAKTTLAWGALRLDPLSTTSLPASAVTVSGTAVVPAVRRPLTMQAVSAGLGGGVVASSELVSSRKWPTEASSILLSDPSGPISQATQERLAALTPDDAEVYVERGFESPIAIMLGILFGVIGLILLVVTLTSTALTLAEQRSDDATLAALGATRGTRRAMAAAQAFMLSAVGSILGVAVGIIPGIALAITLTRDSYDPLTGDPLSRGAIIEIPWPWLALAATAVPIIAAALAAGGIRKAPDATQRTS